jgi:uroporphyrin-3 C-methyltransferase
VSEPHLPPVAASAPPTPADPALPDADRAAPPPPPVPATATAGASRWLPWAAIALAAVATALVWRTEDRMQSLEQELVRRQQDSQTQATEAALLARQAQELSRDAVAKAALLDARVAEVAQQRGQYEELILSLSRSRDENLLADIEAAVRVAMQQAAITGGAEPVVGALRAADERLTRVGQPRLDAVRRAIGRDVDRIKAVGVSDLATLAAKLDEGVRLVDDAPLLAFEPPASAPAPARAVAVPRAGGHKPAAPPPEPVGGLTAAAAEWLRALWADVASLVRVTRIETPDAVLLAPEQSWFLRENLKLRLLNARLALLSRQFDIAQTDLQTALAVAERHFDRRARKTSQLVELLRSVLAQSRQGGVPRPDDTLAAIATAAAGR